MADKDKDKGKGKGKDQGLPGAAAATSTGRVDSRLQGAGGSPHSVAAADEVLMAAQRARWVCRGAKRSLGAGSWGGSLGTACQPGARHGCHAMKKMVHLVL